MIIIFIKCLRMVTYKSLLCSGLKKYAGAPLLYLNEDDESDVIMDLLRDSGIKFIMFPREKWIEKPMLICRDGYFEGLDGIREFLKSYGEKYKDNNELIS